MENRNKCVYVFLDHRKPGNYIYDDLKFDYEPIYVGKGNIDRPNRHKDFYKYINKYNNKYKCLFYSKIISIINDTNIFPNYIFYKTGLTYNESNNIEINLIKKIGRIQNGGILTNMTDGGDGQSEGYKPSEETKRKISEINKRKCRGEKNGNFGKKITDYHKNKISESNRKKYELIDINGNKTIVNNLPKFCKDNNLSLSCIRNVISGHSKKYQKWISIKKINK